MRVVQCDNCKEDRPRGARDGWASIEYGKSYKPIDLCPSCAKDFLATEKLDAFHEQN